MKKYFFLLLIFISSQLYAQVLDGKVSSPNGRVVLEFNVEQGLPKYSLYFDTKPVIKNSPLGLELERTGDGAKLPDAAASLTETNAVRSTFNETWAPVWGEQSHIKNEYNQYTVSLKSSGAEPIQYNIVFRVFNDGIGFRYDFPQQPHMHYFTVVNEKTSFALQGDHTAWWIPGDYENNEYNPIKSRLSAIDADTAHTYFEISTRVPWSKYGVQTPLMLKTDNGLYINIHEAALINYPAMQLLVDPVSYTLTSQLVPNAVGKKAYLRTPFATPWRTIIVSDKATDILASKTILNLNEPSRITNTDFIKPTKYVGIWWAMHVGTATWDLSGTQDGSNVAANKKPHGANTASAKNYIDFAARHGFDGVLIEGWNTGWEDWFGNLKEDVFDFVTPYPDFDIKGLQQYAAAKGVKIIMHHETSGSVTNYERQMDTAYRFMKAHGYDAVKTGYVGRIIPYGEHHDGQWMVNHYNRVAEKTADYKIMLDAHEPVRPTGLHRTWPNWLASEAARGNEFNAWSKGNMPEHETVLPFTRLMGGPMDYTPGIFELKMKYYDPAKTQLVHTTLTKQLALYLTMYSPLQMAADLPENYEKRLDAFQFIKDVPVDWQESRYLLAEPGEYITVARKDKHSNDWFLGAITNAQPRSQSIRLDFLDAGRNYEATIYADAPGAAWNNDAADKYVITKKKVNKKTILRLSLAPGGGTAIRFRAL